MKELTPEQQKRAIVLLDVIVRPGDEDVWPAAKEAQDLLGYYNPPPKQIRRRRTLEERLKSYSYGPHRNKATKETKGTKN